MTTRRTLSANDGTDAIAMLDAEKRVAPEPDTDGTELGTIRRSSPDRQGWNAPVAPYPRAKISGGRRLLDEPTADVSPNRSSIDRMFAGGCATPLELHRRLHGSARPSRGDPR